MNEQMLKSVTPCECPHCKKKIFAVYNVAQPELQNILTEEEIAEAKKTFVERMKEIEFKDEKERELAETWIKSEQTIFGLGEIEPLLKTMAMSQLPDIDEQGKD